MNKTDALFSLITSNKEPRLARAAVPKGRWAGAPGRTVTKETIVMDINYKLLKSNKVEDFGMSLE